MRIRELTLACCITAVLFLSASGRAEAEDYSVRQVTFGPKHHFFGYIGHVGTIPWNASGQYLVALQVGFQDRLPGVKDAAEIVLLDTERDYEPRVVDRTLAWNPQQGTMLYWNPDAPDTQFFFNDRDPETGKVFAVLFDISKGSRGERVREYRFADTPVGNSGVAQKGGAFLGVNYGRLARLRPVTGYLDAWDWTVGDAAPYDDGIFHIDVHTGKKRLLVSYARLREELRDEFPRAEGTPLFINHTLCNRDNDRIFFFVRGDFDDRQRRINVPFTCDMAGNLVRQQFIGGHPEWETGPRMIGQVDDRQVLYDTDSRSVIGTLGPPGAFPNPGGDIALSPDATRFVNGFGTKDPGENRYVFLFRKDNKLIRTRPFSRGAWTSGPLRIDPAPCWNRTSNQIVVSAIADDQHGSRQLFVIDLRE